jgi:hypothetical protein
VFFQKWAGRSVWYDRRVRNAEAAGSNPARSTFTPARPIFETMLFHNNQVLMNELVKATFEIADEVNVEELQNIQASNQRKRTPEKNTKL